METEQFGQYRLEQLIGRGGMGEVYRARDTVRGRVVALKRLPSHMASDGEFQARFRKESELASRLTEPHIIPIHDFGEINGRLFIDMRLVDGRDLSTVLKETGPMAPERAVAVVTQVASALDAAHADGLVHRDVKPSNVLLTGDAGREFVYLVDFGIARSIGAGDEASLTAAGSAIGTLDYMAPERFLETRSDHLADVYSLACLLFESLTGHKPFRSDGAAGMINAHLNMEPPRPSRERPGVPAALDEVVARGMAKNPADRYPSARALADAAVAALRNTGAAGASTVFVDRTPPPVWSPGTQPMPGRQQAYPAPHQPAQQAPPWPPARTMVGLPNAGFSPPGAPGTGPRTRWPLVAAAVAVIAVVVTGVAVAVPLLAGGGGPLSPTATTTASATATTSTTATSSPTTAPTSTAADEFPQPASLAGGDAAADKALWDTLKGTGVVWSGCKYSESAITTTLSYLLCDASSPALDLQLGFESYASPTEVKSEVDGYAANLTGNAGTCETGGRFEGSLLGREVACGNFTFDDGSIYYYIVWTKSGGDVLATAADRDPDRAWQWFLAHDPF